jgi:hypothetical protein
LDGVSRVAGFAVLFFCAAVCGAALAAGPVITLTDGQTRWFVGSSLKAGQTIHCLVAGKTVQARVPSDSLTLNRVWWDDARARTIQISRRADAAEVACGSAAGAALRTPTLPYVVGQNGLGLIQGRNHRSQLLRVFGTPTSRQACTVTWGQIGLRATFSGGTCKGDPTLASARITGLSWSTILGARVADELAEMRWLQPGAKQISPGRWRLAVATHKTWRSTLYATVGGDGRVATLEYVAVPR